MRVARFDTDAGGRIHFTAAFRYAEAVENGLRRRLDLLADWADYLRRHVEAHVRRVLAFEDEIGVRIRPERVGRTSITWVWEIVRDGSVWVDGRHAVVHVDRGGGSDPLPSLVRERLEKMLEG